MAAHPPRLLVATGNAHKLAELRALLGSAADVVTPADLGLSLDVEETGATFATNALLKAQAGCAASGLPCLADDSGLCVDALGGAPGVRSARFARDAGRGLGDAANRALLLERLATVATDTRQAHFVCAIALAAPHHAPQQFEGRVDGTIGYCARGDHGFGYDSLFVVDGGRTFAELSRDEKQAISHRGRALRAALPHLRAVLSA